MTHHDIERRAESSGPPTIITQAYRDMDDDDRTRIERLGMGMVVFGAGTPVIAGVFYELATLYWIFASGVAAVGVCLMFPALGVWFIDRVLKFVALILPMVRDTVRPDPRGDG